MTSDGETLRCGCCGTTVAAADATQLRSSPGVFICSGCAQRRRSGSPYRGVIPILPTSDVDRSCAYYLGLGFTLVERYDDGYLLMNAGESEIHFAKSPGDLTPGEMFVWVDDANTLWKRLNAQSIDGLGPLQDEPWGLREFATTDPDGNRVRFGSRPAHP